MIDNVKLMPETANELRKKCTMIFQRTTLLRGSVYDNVAYGLRLRGLDKFKVERRVEEALAILRLEGLSNRNARKLSGGEQQRVSLARALALKCDIVLLDEPTSNLDPKSLSIFQETLSWLKNETDTTIVIATHNLVQAKKLSKRLVLLEDGSIIEEIHPDNLFGKPSQSMARFLLSDNVFSGSSQVIDGISHIDIGVVTIVATESVENRTTLHIRPQDIIISLDNVKTSARNQFYGVIRSIEDIGSIIRLKIDVGRIFTVQITKRSLNEMNLGLGSEVYISFKASSVNII